jgi:hypothetical protein
MKTKTKNVHIVAAVAADYDEKNLLPMLSGVDARILPDAQPVANTAVQWLRNNYQSYENIVDLCDAMAASLNTTESRPQGDADKEKLIDGIFENSRLKFILTKCDEEFRVFAEAPTWHNATCLAQAVLAADATAAHGVPDDVLLALSRMESPLHESVLQGVTAERDARDMKIIGDFIRSLAAPSARKEEE